MVLTSGGSTITSAVFLVYSTVRVVQRMAHWTYIIYLPTISVCSSISVWHWFLLFSARTPRRLQRSSDLPMKGMKRCSGQDLPAGWPLALQVWVIILRYRVHPRVLALAMYRTRSLGEFFQIVFTKSALFEPACIFCVIWRTKWKINASREWLIMLYKQLQVPGGVP